MNNIEKEAMEKAKRALVINRVKANATPLRKNTNKARKELEERTGRKNWTPIQ